MIKIINKIKSKLQNNVFYTLGYRDFDRFVKQHFKDKKEINGVEIGVAEGTHAKCMLFHLRNLKRLYLIDPYVDYPGSNFSGDSSLVVVKKVMKPFGERAVFIREFSNKAVDKVPGDLDFIYIDGNHRYKYITEDIAMYYPKVKPGGVFGGHDFRPRADNRNCGVPKAVIEFVEQYNLELFGEWDNWWVIKPER